MPNPFPLNPGEPRSLDLEEPKYRFQQNCGIKMMFKKKEKGVLGVPNVRRPETVRLSSPREF